MFEETNNTVAAEAAAEEEKKTPKKTGRKTAHKVPCLQESQRIGGYPANNRPDEYSLLAAWKRHPTDSSPLNRCIRL